MPTESAAAVAPTMTVDTDDDDDDDDDTGHHGGPAAAPQVFDARSLVIKREPALSLLAADDAAVLGGEVHGSSAMLRGGGGAAASAFGFVDVGDGGNQQLLPPPSAAAAVYHPFGAAAVAPSPRFWTTESMVSAATDNDFDVSTAPRMASCGGGRPQTAVSSEGRSSTSPTTRIQPLNAVDAATITTGSTFFIGTHCTLTTAVRFVNFT